MCNALREIMKEEMEEEKEKGKEIGKEIGRKKQLVENVEAVKQKLKISTADACDILNVSSETYQEALKQE